MMKSLFWILGLACAVNSVHGETFLDTRFEAGGSVPASVSLIHNQINGIAWQGFFKIFPNNMIWEIGPMVVIKPISLTARVGAHFKQAGEELRHKPKGALVINAAWRSFKFLSINEVCAYKGTEYFYESELRCRFAAAHLESIFVEKQFEPFWGLAIYPDLRIPGSAYFSYLWQKGGAREIARIGYKVAF